MDMHCHFECPLISKLHVEIPRCVSIPSVTSLFYFNVIVAALTYMHMGFLTSTVCSESYVSKAPKISFLDELSPEKDDRKIKVRIVCNINMPLVDEQASGFCIQLLWGWPLRAGGCNAIDVICL